MGFFVFVHKFVHTERPSLFYLTKINKTYYSRMRIPLDLKQHFRVRELKQTLGTTCYSSAKSLVKKHIAET